MSMQVLINQQPRDLPAGSTLADALATHATHPASHPIHGPYAAAVNLRFVPRTQYALTPLNDGDQIEIIAPVTGG